MARNPNIDDDTRARAMNFVEDAGMPKPGATGRPSSKQRVVSKKELEESGLSLRDFLNKERGLTRRGMSLADAKKQLNLGERPSAKSVADAKAQLGIDDSTALDRNYVRRDMKDRMDVIDRETQGDFLIAMKQKPRRAPEPLTSIRKPGTNVNYENEDATSETFKKGGRVSSASKRADGCAVRGKTRA